MVDFHCHVSLTGGYHHGLDSPNFVSLKTAANDFGPKVTSKGPGKEFILKRFLKIARRFVKCWKLGFQKDKPNKQTNQPTHDPKRAAKIGRVKSDHPENWVPKYKCQSVNPSVKCCSTLIGHDMSTERNLGMLDSRYFQ